VNRTLVKLDLSCNGLSPIMGVYLVRSLRNNVTLTDVNLSKNSLNDDFAEVLAETLKVNETLWKVDISHNPIGEEGAKMLLKSIKENNDSLESLGDEFEANSASMGVVNIEEIRKVLKQNKVSKEIRSKMLYEGTN
jgi:Ran GTPase-activating protein (RanGAP) involved in mRNA processing and transport